MLKVSISTVDQGLDAPLPQSIGLLYYSLLFMYFIATPEVKSDGLSSFRRHFEYISIYMNLNNLQVLSNPLNCLLWTVWNLRVRNIQRIHRMTEVLLLGVIWKLMKWKSLIYPTLLGVMILNMAVKSNVLISKIRAIPGKLVYSC